MRLAIGTFTSTLYLLVLAAAGGDGTRSALGVLLVTLLVPVTLIDVAERRIPNALTLPAAVAAVMIVAAGELNALPEHLLFGVAAFTFLFVAAVARPGDMGLGDVKLAGVLGLCLGRAVAPGLLVALAGGVVVGGIVLSRGGLAQARQATMPFGPCLALGGLVGFFVGEGLLDAYVAQL